ncbi:hypothetical protein RHGRI_015379 [Rhododendron griersonianum]|uniref:Mitochondrial uncoupling protein 1 n=1 Tax=Rhododendron griersonianum TaxID=479676 RepID=A0AAV6KD32_9ERIC|nr:hypothetical protein RHGRI_015379 [Rhododendron griersonianum]
MAADHNKKSNISFAGMWAGGGIAACLAEQWTTPWETAKVRLQLPGLHCQFLFGGLRIGMYEHVKAFYVGDNFVGDVPLSKKVLAALTTGESMWCSCNYNCPTDLVEVRHSGALNAYSAFVRKLCPEAHIFITMQTFLKILGFTDNVVTRLLSGLGAGFFAVCIGSPVCVGPFAFYEGFIPNFGRLGSRTVIMFLTLEQLCTIPLDTAKVRLQLQKKAVAGDALTLPKYKGMLGTVATIAREEGLASLWKGIVPGLHRQCLFGGLRIGMYEPVKAFYVGDNFVGDVPLSKKVLAAFTTGALAITIANPTDLVKVRLQAEGKLPPGVPRRYSGALNAYSTILRQEGVGALWTGLGPNVARNAIINAAELASYDQVKELCPEAHFSITMQTILKIPGFTDNVVTHLFSGLGAGFFAVCIGSPVDVVKSRMMGDSSAYKNTLDCFVKTLKNDGPLAFYKGFIPNFGRLGSWNVIMFLTLEQAKKFVRSIESP